MQSCSLHILFQKEDGFISNYEVNSKGKFLNHKFKKQKKRPPSMLSPFYYQYEVNKTPSPIQTPMLSNPQQQIPIQTPMLSNPQQQIPIHGSIHTTDDDPFHDPFYDPFVEDLFNDVFVDDAFDNPFLDDLNFSNLSKDGESI